MCDDRERLIGYVYGECEADEREAIDAHVLDCHVCRREIAALRGVRQDLLAWDVPVHEPIWRPAAPAPPVRLWQGLPAWALAAAAGLMLMAGAAGGVGARLLMPLPSSAGAPVDRLATAGGLATTSDAGKGTVTPVAYVTTDDLARVEERLMRRMQLEVESRAQLVSAHDTTGTSRTAPSGISAASVQQLVTRLAEVENENQQLVAWRNKQINLNVEFEKKFGQIYNRGRADDSMLQRVSLDLGH